MIITNKFGLPAQLMRALQNPGYSRGEADFSVTQLIAPPFQTRLRKTEEPVIDATQMVKAMVGTAVHEYLATRGASDDAISEERLFMTVDGYVISGAIDNIEAHTVEDTKTTSVWAYKAGGKIEWEQQLNIYAQLCREKFKETGDDRYRIERLAITAIFTDFSDKLAGFDGRPDAIVKVIDVPLWDEQQAMAFLRERIRLHTHESPEPCSDEERWTQPEKWALMKIGRKSAVKLYDSPHEASAAKGAGMYIESRPAVHTRCERYCDVSHVCKHFNNAAF